MEDYVRWVLEKVIATICRSMGFHAISSTSLSFMTDLMDKYMKEISGKTKEYYELLGRTEANLDDLDLAFRHMNINIEELAEYVRNVDSIPCPVLLPKFSVHSLIHKHEQLPEMYSETKQEYADEKSEALTNGLNESPESNGIPAGNSDNPPPYGMSTRGFFKFSGELQPFREIQSVTMTTSGFLIPAREGKLPEICVPQQQEGSPERSFHLMIPPGLKSEKKRTKKLKKTHYSREQDKENEKNWAKELFKSDIIKKQPIVTQPEVKLEKEPEQHKHRELESKEFSPGLIVDVLDRHISLPDNSKKRKKDAESSLSSIEVDLMYRSKTSQDPEHLPSTKDSSNLLVLPFQFFSSFSPPGLIPHPIDHPKFPRLPLHTLKRNACPDPRMPNLSMPSSEDYYCSKSNPAVPSYETNLSPIILPLALPVVPSVPIKDSKIERTEKIDKKSKKCKREKEDRMKKNDKKEKHRERDEKVKKNKSIGEKREKLENIEKKKGEREGRKKTHSNNKILKPLFHSFPKISSLPMLQKQSLFHFIDQSGNEIWICPVCRKQDDGSPMIGCDDCDLWYHWICAGVYAPPATSENWYCSQCLTKEQKLHHNKRKKLKKKARVPAYIV